MFEDKYNLAKTVKQSLLNKVFIKGVTRKNINQISINTT